MSAHGATVEGASFNSSPHTHPLPAAGDTPTGCFGCWLLAVGRSRTLVCKLRLRVSVCVCACAFGVQGRASLRSCSSQEGRTVS
jgi:hypothetical protein